MNKNTLGVTLVVAALVGLVGCENAGTGGGDDGTTITSLSGTIASWALGSGYTVAARDNDDDSVTYGSSTVGTDGSFSVSLRTPTSGEMQAMSGLQALGLTVSNTDANYAQTQELTVVDSNDAVVGTITYESGTNSLNWYYTDAPVTVDGSFTLFVTLTYDNVSYSAGWNPVKASTNTTTFATTYTNGSVAGTWTYYPD